MNKKTIITILLALVAMAGQAQMPKDSCSIPKDSLCQERIAKSDTINCPLDKLFLLKVEEVILMFCGCLQATYACLYSFLVPRVTADLKACLGRRVANM